MNTKTIKVAKAEALPQIIDFYQKAHVHLAQKGVDQWAHWKTPSADQIEWVKNGLANQEFHFLYLDQNLCGIFRLMTQDLVYWGPMPDKAYYIHSLILNPDYLGQGLGAWILRSVESKAKSNNIQTLRLDCVANNKKLCNYYENQGFKKLFDKQMSKTVNTFFEKML